MLAVKTVTDAPDEATGVEVTGSEPVVVMYHGEDAEPVPWFTADGIVMLALIWKLALVGLVMKTDPVIVCTGGKFMTATSSVIAIAVIF